MLYSTDKVHLPETQNYKKYKMRVGYTTVIYYRCLSFPTSFRLDSMRSIYINRWFQTELRNLCHPPV